MAAPDPYAAIASQVFTASNWKEDAANYSPGGGAIFGPQGGEAPLVGKVDWLRVPACLRFFLGYSNITPIYPAGGPYYLQRTPPVRHPRYPRLICNSVGAEDFKLKPRGVPASGAYSIKTVETALPDLPAGTPSPYNTLDGTPLNFQTSYDKSKITARFAPIPYRMLGDSEVQIGGAGGQEWRRWVWINQAPKTEVISLSGFTQTFTEGSGWPTPNSLLQPISNQIGQNFQSEIGTILVKSDIEITWENVPEGWIFGRDSNNDMPDNFPRNILLGLGTVNETNFLGYLAGTLLLQGVMLERKPWPLAAGGESPNSYSVRFQCSFFDPVKGFSLIAAVPTQLKRLQGDGEPLDPRGHNCLIARGSGFAGDPNAGLWFGATYSGSSTGNGQFGKSEFRKLFNTPLNPY